MTNEQIFLSISIFINMFLLVLWFTASMQNSKNKAGWKQCIRISNGYIKENQNLFAAIESTKRQLQTAQAVNVFEHKTKLTLLEECEQKDELIAKICEIVRPQFQCDNNRDTSDVSDNHG